MLVTNRVQQLLDAFFQGPHQTTFSAERCPQPRVWKGEASIIFELDLPGQTAKSIEVTSERNTVRVKWSPIENNAGTAKIQESYRTAHGIEFQVPFHVRADRTDIVQHNGVLRIKLDQPKEELPQKLNVKNG